VRTVPVPCWVKCELEGWLRTAGIDHEKLFRPVNKVGKAWGDGMSEKSVWHIVKESANAIGLDKMAPHDLRAHALGSATLRVEN
jgi:hypothetical protein